MTWTLRKTNIYQERKQVTAYLVIDLDVTDLEAFMVYTQQIPELIAEYQGQYVVKGVEPTEVQGNGNLPQRSVILQFPSRELAEQFLHARRQSDLYDIWLKSTRSRILLVEGFL